MASALSETRHALRSRIELRSVLLLGLIGLALWIFAEVAGEVVEGDTHAFDRAVVESLRNADDPEDPWGPRWVEEIGRDFTALGGVGVLVLVSVGAVVFLALSGNRRAALYVGLAVALGLVASVGLKELFDRPRPELVPHLSEVYTSSFPSGHSMMSALTYLTLAGLLARQQRRRAVKVFLVASAAVLTVLVGLSRVYLGVHYPTDVVAGWTAGIAWALACMLLARRLGQRGQIEPEEEEDGS